MSIRFRLTLLYSTILALTLGIFGVTLYSVQSQTTYEDLKKEVVRSSETVGSSIVRNITGSQISPAGQPQEGQPNADGFSQEPLPPDAQIPDSQPPDSQPPDSQPPRDVPPPVPFENISDDREIQKIPEREIVRLLDSEGNLVASPFGKSEDALPLSTEGIEKLNANENWWQTEYVDGRRMLIYSRPIVTDGSVQYILQVARPLTERDRSLQLLSSTLFLASIITILAAFLIGWVLSGISLQPIHRITQTAQAIGNERDFTKRVDYQGPQDEVGQLATTFNSMLSRLEDAYKQVAESLEKQRNFVADISHELRTPLTTLRGNLGLLRRVPSVPAEERDDILSDMVHESDRLIRLVNHLLVLARADVGRKFSHELIAIRPLIEEVCRQVQLTNQERKISLNVPPYLTVFGDSDAFKQVVFILLDNALKHSQGEIIVSASEVEHAVELTVQDFGEGIPPEKLEHIFDRFYRGSEHPASNGFGLGLSIAKSLMENQGQSIRIESEPGKGSTFTVTLSSSAADELAEVS